jgi:cephalosporin hydroxylase
MLSLSFVQRTMSAARSSGLVPAVIAAEARRRGAKQKVREFAALVADAQRIKPEVVVEIGSLKGGTLWAWCRVASPTATIISVDLPGGDFGGGYLKTETPRIRGYAGKNQTLHLIQGDSHAPATLEEVKRLLRGRDVDVLFIDGDHTFEGVAADYEMYGPLVRAQGIIAFHDIVEHPAHVTCEVHRLWADLPEPRREYVDADDAAWGGIGVLTPA